jgi:hypothetical protein
LIAGVLDIAYSQNYNISLTYILGFIKEITKEKDIQEVLLTLGDFFANNPKILTLDEKNKGFWSKSATDLADFFYFFDNFYKSFCEEKDSSEASKIMIEGIGLVSALVNQISQLAGKSLDLCSIIAPSSISSLFTKWGDGLAQKVECKFETSDSRKKIKIDYDPAQGDGCIRIPDDLRDLITSIVDSLQVSETIKKSILNLLQSLFPARAIAFHPGNFFGNPTSLRNFLPLVRKISQDNKEKYIFVIEKEEEGKDIEHFKGEIFTLEYDGTSKLGFPTPETAATPIPKDCVPGGRRSLYIAFSDPTFNNSLFITTYLISQGDNCFSWEQSEDLADDTYYKIFDKKNQNYALNKLVNKILRFLPE